MGADVAGSRVCSAYIFSAPTSSAKPSPPLYCVLSRSTIRHAVDEDSVSWQLTRPRSAAVDEERDHSLAVVDSFTLHGQAQPNRSPGLAPSRSATLELRNNVHVFNCSGL